MHWRETLLKQEDIKWERLPTKYVDDGKVDDGKIDFDYKNSTH